VPYAELSDSGSSNLALIIDAARLDKGATNCVVDNSALVSWCGMAGDVSVKICVGRAAYEEAGAQRANTTGKRNNIVTIH